MRELMLAPSGLVTLESGLVVDLATMATAEEKATGWLHYGSTGPRVRHLQTLLNKNRFHTLGTKLVVDGEMKSLTCGAVQTVKKWAGYKAGDFRPVAGPFFIGLLEGDALPSDYKRRRQQRIEAKEEQKKLKPLRSKALSAAKKDVGLIEGANNLIKFNTWWCGDQNDGEPYCVRAGSYWYAKAGCPYISRSAGRFQGTDYLLACAKAGTHGVHLTSDPNAGNGFVIDFSGKSDPDHFGLYVSGGSQLRSLEANATLASGKQGVGYHTRARANCWFIVFEK